MTEQRLFRRDAEEVERVLQELRSAVRREAGYLTEEDIPTGPTISAVRDVADLSIVSAHLPLRSNVPVIGSLIVFVQRVLRFGLRWYINPIVEQQNAFNDAVVRALTEIELRQTDLMRRIEQGPQPPDETTSR